MITKIALIFGNNPEKHLDTLHLFPSWEHKKQQFVDAHYRKSREPETSKLKARLGGAAFGTIPGVAGAGAAFSALKGKNKYLRALATMGAGLTGIVGGAGVGELMRRKDRKNIHRAQDIIRHRDDEKYLLPKVVKVEARNRAVDARSVNDDLVHKQNRSLMLRDAMREIRRRELERRHSINFNRG